MLHLSGSSESGQYGKLVPAKELPLHAWLTVEAFHNGHRLAAQQHGLLSKGALASADRLQRLLPAGVSICGAWARGGEEQDGVQRLKEMAAAAQAIVLLLFCL